jgi:peroxiredoxin
MKLLWIAFLWIGVLGAQEPPPVLEIGSPAPAFTLPGIDDRDWSLEDFKDAKVLCVIFTCNHCPDAYAARGRMAKLHADYKDKGVALVAINGNNPIGLRPDELGYSPYGDSFEEMKPFAEESGWEFPYLYDGETQAATMAYGAQSTPHVFVFGPDRKLRYTGRMDDARRSAEAVEKSYVREAIDAILAGEEVETPTTRSFGCSTKWLWKKASVKEDQAKWEKLPVILEDMDVELAKKIRANGAGTVRLINFWSTTCAPCLAEFPELIETYRRFQNRNFDLVTISLDPADAETKARKVLQKHHAAVSPRVVPALREEDRKTINYRFSGANPDDLAEAIDPEWEGALPYTLLLSPEGEIVWKHHGMLDFLELRREILKALDGEG